jgi:hypothetical protein
MGLNIDSLIRAGDVEIQHRIRRYDVNWGRPHFAVTYKRLLLAKMPIVYWSMEQSDYGGSSFYSRNWGSAGRDQDLHYFPSDGTGLVWDTGQADPTDSEVDFGGVGYANSIVSLSNSYFELGYSIVMWIKPNRVLDADEINGLLCKQLNVGVRDGGLCSIVLQGYEGVNRLGIVFNDDESIYLDTADVIFEVDKWYCVVVTVQPGGDLTYPNLPISADNPRLWVDTNPVYVYVNGVKVWDNDAVVLNEPDFDVTNCNWIAGAVRFNDGIGFNFDGHMDEVGVFPIVFNQQTATQIYGLGLGATYLEPDEDFDNDVVGSYADQRRYGQLILADSPTNYWKMDEVLDGGGDDYKYVPDAQSGLANRNLSVARGAGQWNENRIVESPILSANYLSSDPPGKALKMSGDDYPGFIRDFEQLEDTGEQTVEVWFKKDAWSSHPDGIIGLTGFDHGKGFNLAVKSDDHWGVIFYMYWHGSDHTKKLFTSGKMIFKRDTWYHVVSTLNKDGEARLYVDGQLVDSASWGKDWKYKYAPTSNLFVGGWDGDPRNTQPVFYIDDIALYSKALSANQVYTHYWTGKLGPYAKINLTGGDPLQEPSPFIIGVNEYSVLENEEDITEFVDSYNFDEDIKQLVSTASMTVYEDWNAGQINTKLNANTYVKIDRRFRSQSLDYDSGWVSMGHFLVEGPIGSSVSASGSRTAMVALKGLNKLFTLDLAHTPIEPDRLLVRKRKLDVVTSTVEYTKYHMSRDSDNPDIDNVFQNWAEFPSTKIWVTDFKNYDKNDSDKGGINDPKEVIRIKGSEGAVRILGGEGAVTIDNTYLLDKVSDRGLGDPSTIMAEFYRYATIEDKKEAEVLDMFVLRNRWQLTLEDAGLLIDGKSILVRTGNAKGKLWKLVSNGTAREITANEKIDADTVLTNIGTEDNDWVKGSSYGSAPPPPGDGTQYAIQAVGDHTIDSTFNIADIPLTAFIPRTSVDWDDNSKITGIKVKLWRRCRNPYGFTASRDAVKDHIMQIRVGSLYTVSNPLTSYWPTTTIDWTLVEYGGDNQTLGVNWTWGQIKDSLEDVSFQFAVTIDRGPLLDIVAEFYEVSIELIIEDLGVITLHDIHGYPVNPEYEGLAVGDVVQIGDYNSVEDAIRKVAYRCGFQENDSSKPFYFELDACPTALAPSVPPIRPKISDQTHWGEIVEQLLQYAPPNYRLSINSDGVLRGQLVGFLIGAAPNHQLVGRLDINEDHGDYGIATRLVIEGESTDTFNVGLNIAAGGTSAVRAYVLDGYADPSKHPDKDDYLGITITQDQADAKWQQVFNGNPKTPVPSGGNSAWVTRYGVILAQEGKPKDVKRWKYEDTALCAIDIGRASTGTPIEIEALEFTWFNHYLEGNTISQSLIVHYMTEADYEAEFGAVLSSSPDQDDMSYFPSANSRAWKLLVDEFALEESTTTIESGEFEGGLPVGCRFLKFTNGQSHYRFPMEAPSDKDAGVRVTLAECKIWTSRRIIATAELGVSGIFGTGDYKELATRLRRRTDYLEKNLYLNNFDKAKSFALAELQERYVDFTPIAVTAFAPTVEVADIVYLIHPETRIGKTYLVVAASHDVSGVGKFQVLNYDIN